MSLCKKHVGWIYAIVLEMLFKSFVKDCRPNHVYKSLNTTHLNSYLMDKHIFNSPINSATQYLMLFIQLPVCYC